MKHNIRPGETFPHVIVDAYVEDALVSRYWLPNIEGKAMRATHWRPLTVGPADHDSVRWAADRNNPDEARVHAYVEVSGRGLLPMCGYGWNRSNGHRFSILRGYGSRRGRCKLCEKNVAQKKEPVVDGFEHKTRWL